MESKTAKTVVNSMIIGGLAAAMFCFGYLTASYQIRIEYAQNQLDKSIARVRAGREANELVGLYDRIQQSRECNLVLKELCSAEAWDEYIENLGKD